MPLWNDMVRTALLGTERADTAWQAEGKLGAVLDSLQAQAAEPATQFLRCAAVVANYSQAGQSPTHAATAPPVPAAPDARPAMPSLHHLRSILGDERLRAILPEWLDQLARSGLRAPEMAIPTLLTLAARNRDLRPAVLSVIGTKGLWLAGQHPDWQPLLAAAEVEPIDEALWETGTLEQRLAWLTRSRRRDPVAARERLASVWSREGARDRRKLMEALDENLGPEDLAFLEAALADRSKEVRAHAAGLLARIPGSTLQTGVREATGAWLIFDDKTGLLGKLKGRKGQLHVVLPDAWNDAWAGYAISEKAPKGVGQKVWWLEQLLGLVDPDHWCATWGRDADALLGLVEGHEWQSTLLAGWRRAALRFQNPRWAEALIRQAPSPDAALWEILEDGEREALLGQALARRGFEASFQDAFDALRHLDHRWSEPFSGAVLQACVRFFREQTPFSDYSRYAVLRHAALHLDPRLLHRMEQRLEPCLQEASPWCKIVTEMLDTLRFRKDMVQTMESARPAALGRMPEQPESTQRGEP